MSVLLDTNILTRRAISKGVDAIPTLSDPQKVKVDQIMNDLKARYGSGQLGKEQAAQSQAQWWQGVMTVLTGDQKGLIAASVTRQREQRRRQECASHLRQIWQALTMYTNDQRDGRYPPDLGTLVKSGKAGSLDVFLCPSVGSAVPIEVAKGGTDEQAKWINERSGYVYFGAGKTNMDAGAILIIEKPENHAVTLLLAPGANVLYGDGHVEWLDGERAASMTAELKSGHNPPRADRP